MKERKAIDLRTNVRAFGYSLIVETETSYFEGDGSGRREELPGWYLEQGVWMRSGPHEEESLVLGMGRKLPLLLIKLPSKYGREITNEPVGYENLLHRDLVGRVREKPQDYITHDKLIGILRR